MSLPSQVPRPTLRCGSGERTPQELGKKLWSHITQQFSRVVTKIWCFLENCIRWEATDVGFTHFPSLVARQEAVLCQCAFATWVAWVSARLPLAVYCCDHMDFSRFPTIFANLHFFHITAPSNHSDNTVCACEADGPLQLLGEGADRAAGRRERAVQLEAAAAMERMAQLVWLRQGAAVMWRGFWKFD